MSRAFLLFCRVCDLHHFFTCGDVSERNSRASRTWRAPTSLYIRSRASAATWRSSRGARSLPPNSTGKREERHTRVMNQLGHLFTFVAWWSPESRSSRTTFPRVTYPHSLSLSLCMSVRLPLCRAAQGSFGCAALFRLWGMDLTLGAHD